ncbi:MAG: DUF6655 family protein [Thermoguttaceae bacterium]|nr:DUF6655 family protein [Thermoguttaceae bacterium]
MVRLAKDLRFLGEIATGKPALMPLCVFYFFGLFSGLPAKCHFFPNVWPIRETLGVQTVRAGCALVRAGVLILLWGLLLTLGGCGTSRWSDSPRTATEQLLISDAIDRAVSKFNFSALAGKTVYLDDTAIRGMTDAPYLSSTVRQHLLASGAILKENKNEADYVLELRAGAIGTDRHDVTYGVPSVTIPNLLPVGVAGIPNQLPEIPLAKKTHQRGVAKIAAFAYNRATGRPVWQSGAIPVETDVRALWVFGAGPFVKSRSGSRVLLAGDPVPLPPVHLALDELLPDSGQEQRAPSVTQEAFFVDRPTPPAAQAPEGPTGLQAPANQSPSAGDSKAKEPSPSTQPGSSSQVAQPAAGGSAPSNTPSSGSAEQEKNSTRPGEASSEGQVASTSSPEAGASPRATPSGDEKAEQRDPSASDGKSVSRSEIANALADLVAKEGGLQQCEHLPSDEMAARRLGAVLPGAYVISLPSFAGQAPPQEMGPEFSQEPSSVLSPAGVPPIITSLPEGLLPLAPLPEDSAGLSPAN